MPRLKFNSQIYKLEAIQEAISAYSHLAKINFKNEKKYINVWVSQIEPKFKKILVYEFGNYVLAKTKICL